LLLIRNNNMNKAYFNRLKLLLRQVALGCALTSLVTMAPAAKASIIAEDQFPTGAGGYTVGALGTQNPTTTGFTGAWTDMANTNSQVNSTSLSVSDPGYNISTVGGDIGSSGDSRVGRTFDSTALVAGTTGTVYMSFLMQFTLPNTNYEALELSGGTPGTYDDNGTRNIQIGIGGDFGGNTTVGIRTNDGTTQQAAAFAGTADTSAHLYVLKFTLSGGTDSLTAWLDPNLTGAGDPTGGITISSFVLRSTDMLGVGNFNNNSVGPQIDNFVMGTTLADVTGAVPEPTTWSLLGIGALALLVTARRKLA
jgi:hypothetical protein